MSQTRDYQLEKAKAFYFSWKLMDAYNILRRYYSRVPFQLEEDHAEYAGIFVRILAELGRLRELNFYVPELERQYRKNPAPHVAYTLARVYLSLPELKLAAAREILLGLIADKKGKSFHTRAKLLLAWVYDQDGEDTAACRAVIDSIQNKEPGELGQLVRIWRAKVVRDLGDFTTAETMLREVLADLRLPGDWYAFTSAKIVLIRLLLRAERLDAAVAELGELRVLCEGRHFRSIELQLADIEKLLQQARRSGVLVFERTSSRAVLKHDDYTWELNESRTTEKLLLLLVNKRFVEKPAIIKHLYERRYRGPVDDKLVYSQVHQLRKQLTKIGLGDEVIAREGTGYRLLAQVSHEGKKRD